jgi:hypothetical protein
MTQETKSESPYREDGDLIRATYPLAAPYIPSDYDPDLKVNGLTGPRAAFLLSQKWNAEGRVSMPEQESKQPESEVLSDGKESLSAGQSVENSIPESLAGVGMDRRSTASDEKVEPNELEKPPQTYETLPINLPDEQLPTVNQAIELAPESPSDSVVPTELPVEKQQVPESAEIRKRKPGRRAPKSENVEMDFYHWLGSLESGKARSTRKKRALTPDNVSNDNPGAFAEKVRKSQELKEDIASETLAALLASQGHRDKAIRMYEKLMEKYPEKRISFAALIEKLNS